MGSKSVLFGAHAFWLHPWFVAAGWWKLYGWNGRAVVGGKVTTNMWDPRLWLSFFLHDLGYVGLPNMDGKEGETHPLWAGNVMGEYFGWEWDDFCVFHSHYWADKAQMPVSALCAADKISLCLTPWWIYLPMARATGEIREYKHIKKHIDEYGYQPRAHTFEDDKRWFLHIQRGVWRKWYATA